MKTFKIAFFILLSVYLYTFFVGCTIVGYGMGAQLDSYNARNSPRSITIEELPIGREILIVRKDNTLIEGEYKGVGYDSTGQEMIIVKNKKSEEEISLESIEQLREIKPGMTGKLIGLGLGIVVDVIILKSIDPFKGGIGLGLGFGQ
jgi:hypothetical protein